MSLWFQPASSLASTLVRFKCRSFAAARSIWLTNVFLLGMGNYVELAQARFYAYVLYGVLAF